MSSGEARWGWGAGEAPGGAEGGWSWAEESGASGAAEGPAGLEAASAVTSAPEPRAAEPAARPRRGPEVFASRGLEGRQLTGGVELGAQVGEDGFGEVYAARSASLPGLGLEVRVYASSLLESRERVASLQEVFARGAAVRSPEVGGVVAFDLGSRPGWSARVALPGSVTLASLLEGGPLVPRAAFLLASRLARALASLHEAGVLHRNLTPGCVRLQGVTREGLARDPELMWRAPLQVVDWGQHVLVATRSPLASFHRYPEGFYGYAEYLPPEVGRGEAFTALGDLYAVGVILYEALTGAPPFTSLDFGRTLRRHVYEAPLRPELARRGLELTPDESALVQQTLARAPLARFGSMDALAGALEAAGYGAARVAPPAPPPRTRTGTLPLPAPAVVSSRVVG